MSTIYSRTGLESVTSDSYKAYLAGPEVEVPAELTDRRSVVEAIDGIQGAVGGWADGLALTIGGLVGADKLVEVDYSSVERHVPRVSTAMIDEMLTRPDVTGAKPEQYALAA